LSTDQFVELVHCRARRKFVRGIRGKPLGLLKRLRKSKQGLADGVRRAPSLPPSLPPSLSDARHSADANAWLPISDLFRLAHTWFVVVHTQSKRWLANVGTVDDD
jgi:hypothetical protein